ncbi:MAG: hypothetical protein IPO26_21205 [Saprospiraceae bacterium]|nr:hypothetical protein [Saprospiraceae bacterium]
MVGSTIKPFVYTQAMAVAYVSPCQEFDDIQYTIAPGILGFGYGRRVVTTSMLMKNFLVQI